MDQELKNSASTSESFASTSPRTPLAFSMSGGSRSKRTPPGIVHPRPQRLPQIVAVRLMTAVRKPPNAAAAKQNRYPLRQDFRDQVETNLFGAAEGGEMHCHAFQFCGYAAHGLIPQRRRNACQRFDGRTKGHRMSNNGVTGN